MSMGKRIKDLRKAKGWSQTELGEKIGLSFGGVSGIEADRRDTSQSVIIKLSEIFDVSTDYLLKGIETERTISENEQEILEILRKDDALTQAIKEAANLKKKAISYLASYKQPEQHAA
jgi:transcriptional regulator with XRE-family HTH domain